MREMSCDSKKKRIKEGKGEKKKKWKKKSEDYWPQYMWDENLV